MDSAPSTHNSSGVNGVALRCGRLNFCVSVQPRVHLLYHTSAREVNFFFFDLMFKLYLLLTVTVTILNTLIEKVIIRLIATVL